ncbi:hypothetical protein M4I21_10490 [Cellulophaga sp. 20_2_10]|uniref:hypothetical protein n=1 Tax=Cellulophaga sp. 20_2_10 TaxID=2942476 RepID=UPI00201ACA92|nr:hypothetical protein [Cellulophaga sp. 20_2_10]MCL5246237.1 hypothetical protein [Cellulophaga sp. 20_2_10]
MKVLIKCVLLLMFLVSCNSNQKQLDIIEVNLTKDWAKISEKLELTESDNNTSEYLNSYETKNIDNIKINTFSIPAIKNTATIALPTENKVAFLFNDKEKKQLVEIETSLNYLNNNTEILNLISDKYGKGKLLSEEGTVNKIKGIENYVWKNIDNNHTLFLSTFSLGNIQDLETKSSKKQYSCILYLVANNAEIIYPNGQKETILERLIVKLSS